MGAISGEVFESLCPVPYKQPQPCRRSDSKYVLLEEKGRQQQKNPYEP